MVTRSAVGALRGAALVKATGARTKNHRYSSWSGCVVSARGYARRTREKSPMGAHHTLPGRNSDSLVGQHWRKFSNSVAAGDSLANESRGILIPDLYQGHCCCRGIGMGEPLIPAASSRTQERKI